MSNRGAIIRFCSAALCVTLFMAYLSFIGLNATAYNDTVIAVISPTHFDTTYQQKSSSQNTDTTNNTSQKPEDSTADNSKFIPVSASGTVQGKAIEKFISPYTANTSYENVYLKNNTK